MSEFRNCNCSWCEHTRFKLISYCQCNNTHCNSIGYFDRVSRIHIRKESIKTECGFLCSFCLNVIPSRVYEEKNIHHQLSLNMCRCALCSKYRNVYEITVYCKVCDRYRKLKRMKRKDKYATTTVIRCGFECEHCRFFHIEVEKQRERIKGQVNCFGL